MRFGRRHLRLESVPICAITGNRYATRDFAPVATSLRGEDGRCPAGGIIPVIFQRVDNSRESGPIGRVDRLRAAQCILI